MRMQSEFNLGIHEVKALLMTPTGQAMATGHQECLRAA